MEGDLTRGGKHTIQYTNDVLQNCTPELNIIFLTNVTPMDSIKSKIKNKISGYSWCTKYLTLTRLSKLSKY